MKVEIIPARLEDCKLLANALDNEGRELIRKGWNVEPLEGLINAFEISPYCMTIFINGKVAGMFGSAEDNQNDIGDVWLTTAPEIGKYKYRFAKHSKKYLDFMKEEYSMLLCCAHKDNLLLINWLKKSGFEIYDGEGDFKQCVYRR